MGKRWEESGEGFSPSEELGLDVVKPEPLNAEATPAALERAVTPDGAHFVRTNFEVLTLAKGTPLRVEGAVLEPREWTGRTLASLEQRTLPVTLECAGNGRVGMAPLPPGEPWTTRAVSTAVWSGVPLRVVLETAVVRDDVCEVLVEGWDSGAPKEGMEPVAFARSLPFEKAMDGDTLLALAMNGRPIPPRHGGPVRLIVPSWYGVASVKWVRRIVARTTPYRGYFQGERYVYIDEQGKDLGLVTQMRVKSLLVQPREGATMPRGRLRAYGWAWSGTGSIERVELSLDGEARWIPTELVRAQSPGAWTWFEATITVDAPGRHTLRVRAQDAQGNVQPERPHWNRLGYGSNAVEVRLFQVQ